MDDETSAIEGAMTTALRRVGLCDVVLSYNCCHSTMKRSNFTMKLLQQPLVVIVVKRKGKKCQLWETFQMLHQMVALLFLNCVSMEMWSGYAIIR